MLLPYSTEASDTTAAFLAGTAQFMIARRFDDSRLSAWRSDTATLAMMRRFAENEAAGRRCVLVLCGDHDPGGLHITDKMRKICLT